MRYRFEHRVEIQQSHTYHPQSHNSLGQIQRQTFKMNLSLFALIAAIFLTIIFIEIPQTNALHFYLDSGEKKCFQEELPVGSTVVGTYRTEAINPKTERWEEDKEDGIDILVLEDMTKHVLVSQVGPSRGKFTFTSVEPGFHLICLAMNSTGGWFNSHRARIYLDIMFGDPTMEQNAGKQKVLDS